MDQMILQLHITGNCNLRCRHCYMEDHCNDMSLETVKTVVAQMETLVEELEQKNSRPIRACIHFTGGEPLLHPQIRQILRFFHTKRRRFHFGIMSNGTVLNFRTLYLLKKLGIYAFQVSLDGDEAYHDRIRGAGNFQKVLRGLDRLHRFGIPTRVSFTANRDNYKLFPQVAQVCREHHVRSLWSDRYIPFDPEADLPALTAVEMPDYVAMLQKERDHPQNAKQKLRVQNQRALQFLCGGDWVYACKAGEAMITVDEWGNIMPCRRLPLICGNIHQRELSQVYWQDPTFQNLRAHRLTDKCRDCQHSTQCLGGERCFTYCIHKDYEQPDPCCWL